MKTRKQGDGSTEPRRELGRTLAEVKETAVINVALPFAVPVSLSPSLPKVPHNLPGQRLPFVGRAAELADITRLLGEDDDCRLLALIGPGAMGKTRLALKAAEQIVATPALQTRFADTELGDGAEIPRHLLDGW